MKRLLPLLIFLAFMTCYLEWPGGNSGFIFQLEYGLFTNGIDKSSLLHPFILLPLVGQILLLLVFLFVSNRKVTIAGILLLSVLVVMLFIIGLLSMNFKILLSTLPFIGLSVYYVLKFRKEKTIRLDM